MTAHKSFIVTVVQLEDSTEAAVRVNLTMPCEAHGEHKMTDDWRITDAVGYDNPNDWIRDMMISLVERY